MFTIQNVWYLKDLFFEKNKGTVLEFPNFLNDDEINFIINKADNIVEQGEVYDGDAQGNITNEEYRNSPVSFLNPDDKEVSHIFRKLTDIILDINAKHYDFTLQFIEPLQYTKYIGNNSKPGFYGKHTDGSGFKTGFVDRKLSFSILLCDPNNYEGGDLIAYTGTDTEGYIPKMKKGTIVFFPSALTHEVTPVTKGERISLVGWINGPEFK